MKRPWHFKVLQLDYPFHFFLLVRIQDADIQQQNCTHSLNTHVKEHAYIHNREGRDGVGERVEKEVEMSVIKK